MKISIVTVCYNAEETIGDTLKSIGEQNYSDIEYIIIDGASTDDTLKIIEKHSVKPALLLSEEDEGIYDAINKGIGMSSGSVIGLLHADDFYADNHVLSDVASAFEENNCDVLYGDLEYVYKEDSSKVFRHWHSGKYQSGLFLKGWMPPHPTLFIKKDLIERYGAYDTSFAISADYEFMLRMIHRCGHVPFYLQGVLIRMRVGGKSNASLCNRIRANREDRRAWRVNGLTPGAFTSVRKPLGKFSQFIR